MLHAFVKVLLCGRWSSLLRRRIVLAVVTPKARAHLTQDPDPGVFVLVAVPVVGETALAQRHFGELFIVLELAQFDADHALEPVCPLGHPGIFNQMRLFDLQKAPVMRPFTAAAAHV